MLKIISIFALLSAVHFAVSTASELEGYTFEKFLAEFNVKYSESELPTRRAIFEKELARVKEHNSKNLSWKEGVTKFSAMTEQEKKAFRGRAKGLKKQNLLKDPTLKLLPEDELPTHVDWREFKLKDGKSGIVSAVKDQGYCGSCWAFASTATIESHVALASDLLFDLSVQQIAFCAPNPNECGGTGGCGGSTAELAFDYVTKSNGLFQEYQYPYYNYRGGANNCSLPSSGRPVATIAGYTQLKENNYLELLNAVATKGPIAVSVDASNWSAYQSGIFDGCNQKQPDIDHAVVLVGYGEEDGKKYWLIRNSWSPTWGEKGFIRILRTDSEESRCGTDITPQDGTACKDDTSSVTVCGTCGVLYDSAYPLNAKVV